MQKILLCPCGYTIRAQTDDELVEQAQLHAREVHHMPLTREQALAKARPE